MVRYDPYTDSFIDNPTKETTATINLDAFPNKLIHVVEVSDESIEKIADAVVRKLADRAEPQTCKEEMCAWWSIGKRYCALMLRNMPCEYKQRFEDEPQMERSE